MRGTVSALIITIVLAVGTGCTVKHIQPTPVPSPQPPTTDPTPHVVLDRPDTLYYMVEYEIYFVPDIRDAVLFLEGIWYLHRNDRWYRGRSYSGPWVYMGNRDLPPRLLRLPRDYRSSRYRRERVPYGHWDQERSRPRPPQVQMERPDFLYFMAAYGVYYVPGERYEIFYTEGAWYTHHRDTWFTGESYRGPWSEVGPRKLPVNLRKLPDDYRSNRFQKKRVPYGHWDQERDVRPGRKPDREPRKGEESWDGRELPPGTLKPSSPEPRGETRSDREPGRKEKPSPRERGDGRNIEIAQPKILHYLKKLDIYFIPGITEEILYYNGAWYLRDKGKWLTGESYNGPWSKESKRKISEHLSSLPENYRSHRYPSKKVPYGHWEDKENRRKQQKKSK